MGTVPKPQFDLPLENRSKAAQFQDDKYGKGIRVHNPAGTLKDPKKRCSICTKVTPR